MARSPDRRRPSSGQLVFRAVPVCHDCLARPARRGCKDAPNFDACVRRIDFARKGRSVLPAPRPTARPTGQSRRARRRSRLGRRRHPLARRRRAWRRIRRRRPGGRRRARRAAGHPDHGRGEARRRAGRLHPAVRRHPRHPPRTGIDRPRRHGARRPTAGPRRRRAAGAAGRLEHRGGHRSARRVPIVGSSGAPETVAADTAVDATEKPTVLDADGDWVPEVWKDMDTTPRRRTTRAARARY